MCKLSCFIGSKDYELTKALLRESLPVLLEHDNHAIGTILYSKEQNNIYGSRFVLKDGTFQNIKEGTYNYFGKESKENNSFILHTRFATSANTIENTHPFYRKGIYLVHNGIVNEDNLEYLTSTCDSEGILNAYVDLDLMNYPDRYKYFHNLLHGWFACIVLGCDKKKRYYVDVFRNNRANLFEVKIKNVSGIFYCTLDTYARRILDNCEMEIETIKKVEPNVLIRHNASTGEIISKHKCKVVYSEKDVRRKTKFDNDVIISLKECGY